MTNRYRFYFLCTAILCVALHPLPASAQLKADPAWPVSLSRSLRSTPAAGEAERINIAYALSDAPETNSQDAKRPFPWRSTPPDSPDWKGATRDTAYFMAYQLVVIATLYVAPESISSWTEEDKENYSYEKWQENVRSAQRDSDEGFVNYVLHPYWGATYYIRGRERGFTRTQSFLFSATLSTLFEFGFEAAFEEPSYQDLWVTPVIGSLVGEYWFSAVRERIKSKPGELTWKDKTILFVTDPLGVVGSATDRVLGLDTRIQVHAFHAGEMRRAPGYAGNLIALASMSQRPVPIEPAWGLRIRVNW